MSTPDILYLILKKKWFDLMVAGKKDIEYRECKPYWKQRLEFPVVGPMPFDEVHICNGYGRCRPAIVRTFIKTHMYRHALNREKYFLYPQNGEPLIEGGWYYAIELGPITERRNC